jgi:GntR family transcriptional regulator of arabinose operon
MILQSAKKPKHERISQDLLMEIQSGKFSPGQRLPTELELTRHYGLSRESVRKALSKLQADGLVVKRQGSGTYVAREFNRSSFLEKVVCIYNFPMVGTLNPAFGAELYEGLVQEAAKRKIGLTLEQATEGNQLASLSEKLIGTIVFAAGNEKPSAFFPGLPSNLPLIVMNRPSPEDQIPSIEFDHEYSAFQAVSFLLRFGHRRIAFIRPPGVANPTCQDRFVGYQRAFTAAGLEADPSLTPVEPPFGVPEYSRWPDILRTLVRGTPRPTALLMLKRERALHILDVLAHEGIRVPEDLSLILFDEDPEMTHCKPAISSVRLPLQEMGRTAVRMIVEMSKGNELTEESMHVKLQPELMIRESVAPPCEGK